MIETRVEHNHVGEIFCANDIPGTTVLYSLLSFGCQANGEVQAGVDQAAGNRRADGDEVVTTKKQKRATWRNCHGTGGVFLFPRRWTGMGRNRPGLFRHMIASKRAPVLGGGANTRGSFHPWMRPGHRRYPKEPLGGMNPFVLIKLHHCILDQENHIPIRSSELWDGPMMPLAWLPPLRCLTCSIAFRW